MTDLQQPETETHPYLWQGLAVMFAFALVILAALHSSALLTAAYDLPEGSMTEKVIAGVEMWNDWMVQSGVSAIGETINLQMEMAHQALVDPDA